ncbi:hypothetical protein Pyn_30364 [Prunus yedoensis var. nudiflora]|uniref:Uncharacterized protein n=1 Tax=Prunus yedoensis var. nudiflora TaxID=2094558 RepID=A0A314XK73_PRUYE|nr:hypothetical protein Pyn_30364 [Prunus yedoensis var. nudiflora]
MAAYAFEFVIVTITAHTYLFQIRCVDELESQLSKHASLKKLYFYHQHLIAVFRNTMFGPEGRPQHCCAWLGVASSFPECASPIVPEEVIHKLKFLNLCP